MAIFFLSFYKIAKDSIFSDFREGSICLFTHRLCEKTVYAPASWKCREALPQPRNFSTCKDDS